jgi:dihydroxyacetone kinase-like protein
VKFDTQATRQMLQAIAAAVIERAAELTELDRAIGDADHGLNLERGFQAVLDHLDEIGARPIDAALVEVGRTLILHVGGASGPLYGKLFATLGRHLGQDPCPSRVRLVAAAEEAVRVVGALGRSEVGDKTLLDVLVPVLEQLRRAEGAQAYAELAQRASRAAQDTIPMIARRGRAAYLGARSRGHMDPGARSCQLMVHAVCQFLEQRS